MEAIHIAACIVCLALTPPQETAVARNDSFSVFAPSKELADEVLAKAQSMRSRVAREWLGRELEDAEGRTIVEVKLSTNSGEGKTWARQPPTRTSHVVSISATRGELREVLAHEIVHVVFLTQFSEGFPVWAQEGIACLQEDSESLVKRRRIAKDMARNIGRSELETLLGAEEVPGGVRGSDSVAASLVAFLLSRGDRGKFVGFATSGKTAGWDTALRQHYQIRGVSELLSLWRVWAAGPLENKRIASRSTQSD